MVSRNILIALFATSVVALPACLLAAGAQPLNSVEVISHQAYGPAQTHNVVPDPLVPGGRALRVVMTNSDAKPWNAGVNSIINEALAKGDRIEATVMLRLSPDAGVKKGEVKVLFQLTDAPYTEFATSQAAVTPDWTPFRLKAKVTTNLAAKKSRIALQLGYGKQTIDVGPILVVRGSN